MPIVTKLMRVVPFREEFPPINSHGPSMRWSCEIMEQIKYIISPFEEDPKTPK